MWTTDFTATTTASPGQVWAALEALHSGTALGPNSDSFELHGPFVAGTTLTVTPQGQDPMESTIIDLEPGRVYADQTRFSDLVLTFRHQLTPALAGGTPHPRNHGTGADEVGPELGPQTSGDFPVAMAELLAAGEQL